VVRAIGVATGPKHEVERTNRPDDVTTRELSQPTSQAIARHSGLIVPGHDDAEARMSDLVGTGGKF
jgi:hypothetical protein